MRGVNQVLWQWMGTMSNIISLDEKLKHSAAQKTEVIRKQKVQAVRKMFLCTQCANKCERCGAGVGQDPQEHSDQALIPYHFCSSCAEEYRSYINALKGQTDPDAYWQNDQWMDLWRRWIDYQGAMDQYMHSKEFRRLLSELRHDPDESDGPGNCPD